MRKISVHIEYDDGDPSVGIRGGWLGEAEVIGETGQFKNTVAFAPCEDEQVELWRVTEVDVIRMEDDKVVATLDHDTTVDAALAIDVIEAIKKEWQPIIDEIERQARYEAELYAQEPDPVEFGDEFLGCDDRELDRRIELERDGHE